MPDGGKLNHYDLDGDSVVPVPPADFNPLVASDADLTTYGMPPRPAADADDFLDWSLDMAAWKPRRPDLGLCITDVHFGSLIDAATDTVASHSKSSNHALSRES